MNLALAVIAVGLAGSAMLSPAVPRPYEAELQLCADRVNAHRASVRKSALRRSAALESFAAEAAASDGLAHVGHQYFRRTNGGGISRAENAIPWWRLEWVGSVRAALERGLQMMWEEGPRGGHYLNMTGDFTEIGCGVFVHNGEVTIVQEFR